VKYNSRQPVALISATLEETKQGLCSSQTRSTLVFHHIELICQYTWPSVKITETIYCIARPTTVRYTPHYPLISDEEMVDPHRIHKGYARTITGALVVWFLEKADAAFSSLPVLKFSDLGFKKDKILIIESLQEGILLEKFITQYPNRTNLWTTPEKYLVYTTQSTPHRQNRDANTLRQTIENEILGKLNYNLDLLENYLERFQRICLQHVILKKSLALTIAQNPDLYAKALLNTKSITAELALPYLLIWPCKPIHTWGVRTNDTYCRYPDLVSR